MPGRHRMMAEQSEGEQIGIFLFYLLFAEIIICYYFMNGQHLFF